VDRVLSIITLRLGIVIKYMKNKSAVLYYIKGLCAQQIIYY